MALKENYRELLIDAVVRVAAREGLDRTTTKLIAAEVPCNEVYIYRNFGSKDALLQAAFSRTDWPSRTTFGSICAIIIPRSSLPAPTSCTTAITSSFRPVSAATSSPRTTAGC